MSKHTIIPAHDERVNVVIEIPRPGKARAAVFSAARLEFQPPELVDRFAKDYERLRAWAAASDAAEAAGEEYDEPRPTIADGYEYDHPLGWWAYTLGLKDADYIANLTVGERDQVWEIWNDASKVSLGE